MAFKTEVFTSNVFVEQVATRIAQTITSRAPVTITGGDTVGEVYERLSNLAGDWTGIDILFSDERGVPPDDERSNYRLAERTLFDHITGATIHRIRGEDEPGEAAAAYEDEIAPLVRGGISVAVLGLGSNAHIAGLFPGDPAVQERARLCVAVDRPDGMKGITLTAPALQAPATVLFVVAGKDKAEAVRRAVAGDEAPSDAPVRLLAQHPECTLLLDEPAASLL